MPGLPRGAASMFDRTRLPFVALDVVCVVLGRSAAVGDPGLAARERGRGAPPAPRLPACTAPGAGLPLPASRLCLRPLRLLALPPPPHSSSLLLLTSVPPWALPLGCSCSPGPLTARPGPAGWLPGCGLCPTRGGAPLRQLRDRGSRFLSSLYFPSVPPKKVQPVV